MLKKLLLGSAASAVMLMSSTAMAEEMSMSDIQAQLKKLATQVQTLSSVVEKQDAVIKKQNAELAAQKKASAEAFANISPAAGVTGDVKISMKPSPKIESADGQYSFQPFGRVHFDVTQIDDDKSDYANNADIRRARLGFKGKLGEGFKYKSEIDFGGEGVNFNDVYLAYTGLDNTELRLGHQKPGFGMELLTSSNYLMFLERSTASNAFTRLYELGFNAMTGGDAWSFGVGVFNEDGGNDSTGEDEDVTIEARGSFNLLALSDAETKDALHVGAGYSHRRPTGDVRVRVRPGTGDGDRVVDTGTISDVDNVDVFNIEFAGVYGPFSFQSEYFDMDVSRAQGNTDASFDGYYAQAGVFLTGESRPYKAKVGNFGRVKPLEPFDLKTGGWGAWEVLARYDNTDLNDESAGITGGEVDTVTLGVNWYLTDYIKIMANVIDVDSDDNAVVANDDPTIYNMRVQWDF